MGEGSVGARGWDGVRDRDALDRYPDADHEHEDREPAHLAWRAVSGGEA
jgi:hypothetical protein